MARNRSLSRPGLTRARTRYRIVISGGSGKPRSGATLNEHLILRHGPPSFAAAAVPAAAVAEKELNTSRHALNQTSELPHRRDYGVVYHVGSFFHPVEGAAEQFIGANDLE